MQLYIFDSTAKLGFSENQITVLGTEIDEQYPIELVKGVSLFGLPYISSKFIGEMLRREIELYFYSSSGHYFGKLHNPNMISPTKQRQQAVLGLDDNFKLILSKKIITGKIKNQIKNLQAHDENNILSSDDFALMKDALIKIEMADSISGLLGFEGGAARSYFSALSKIAPDDFKFFGRSTRPPKDPFNSLLSLGYSMLYKNIMGAIERHGLNPYFGFLHTDAEGHPALASDLMEEWRAVIVDDVVLQLTKNKQLQVNQFTKGENGGVFISFEGQKTFIKALSGRICRASHYLKYDDYKYGFQYALDKQLQRLNKAISEKDASIYEPVGEDD